MVTPSLWSLLMCALVVAATPALAAGETITYGYGLTSDNGDLPQNLMSMKSVRERFGEPRLERPPVGDPPITRWEYDTGTVYFEHNLVITSVPQPESLKSNE